MTSPGVTAPLQPSRATVLPWIGLFLPAASFFTHLQVGYVLVPLACTTHDDLWVHVAGIASVILSALGTLVAYRVWMRARDADVHAAETAGSLTQRHDTPRSWTRLKFMGAVGTGMGAIFTLILLAQWLAGFAIGTCQ